MLPVDVLLTGVAGLRVHRNHHLAACSSPGSQGALQRGDAAGRFVAICSWKNHNASIQTLSTFLIKLKGKTKAACSFPHWDGIFALV